MDQLVQAASSEPGVVAYATYSAAQQREVVFLINKGTAAKTMTVAARHLTYTLANNQVWQLTGKGPTDPSPKWGQAGGLKMVDNQGQVLLPGYSITVLDLRGR